MKEKVEQPNIYKGPRTDEYVTPGWIIDPLEDQYGFDLDLAANGANNKAKDFYSRRRSFLEANMFWGGVAWCNPPFSLASQFFEKISKAAKDGMKCVAIYKSANMETAAWRNIFESVDWIAQPFKRVNYVINGQTAKGVQFASAVIGFNVDPPKVPWPHALLRVVELQK